MRKNTSRLDMKGRRIMSIVSFVGLIMVVSSQILVSEDRKGRRRRRLLRASGKVRVADFLGTVICVATACLAAGLTMGVVSVDPMELRVILRTGKPLEKWRAKRILRVIDREPRHQVLVTLLLLNSAANEALPIFLDNLVPSWAAVVISVTVVLFVGEILPSAFFTGPQKLKYASIFTPLVFFALYGLYPLAYPIAACLDRCLPEDEDKRYTSRQDLRALVDVQRDDAHRVGLAEPFSEDEADLIRGAMSLSSTSVADVMVPVEKIFALQASDFLDQDTIMAIYHAGFSRIPIIQDDGNISEYILLKDLLLDLISLGRHNEFEDSHYDDTNTPPLKKITELPRRSPVWIQPDHSLFDLLNEFQTGSTHIAFVYQPQQRKRSGSRWSSSGSSTHNTKENKRVVGILTLEDIIEVILTEEIYDEADRANALQVLGRFFENIVLPKMRHSTSQSTTKFSRPNDDISHDFEEEGSPIRGSSISTAPLLAPSDDFTSLPRPGQRVSITSAPSPSHHRRRGFSERMRVSLNAPTSPTSTYRRRRYLRRVNTQSADRLLSQPPRQSTHANAGRSLSASRLLVYPMPLARSNSFRTTNPIHLRPSIPESSRSTNSSSPNLMSASSSSIEEAASGAAIVPVSDHNDENSPASQRDWHRTNTMV